MWFTHGSLSVQRNLLGLSSIASPKVHISFWLLGPIIISLHPVSQVYFSSVLSKCPGPPGTHTHTLLLAILITLLMLCPYSEQLSFLHSAKPNPAHPTRLPWPPFPWLSHTDLAPLSTLTAWTLPHSLVLKCFPAISCTFSLLLTLMHCGQGIISYVPLYFSLCLD